MFDESKGSTVELQSASEQAADAKKEIAEATSNEMTQLQQVEDDMHGYIQQELADLKECAPGKDDKKKYFKKNVGAYYKAVNETTQTEQKIKAGGYGNVTTKNLTINLNGLGLADKLKLYKKINRELDELGEKMGYGSKEEVVDVKGENRKEDVK